MTRAQIDAFFGHYAEAFTRREIEGVQSLWAFPALILFGGRQYAMDAEAFRANTEKLCSFYERQGVVRAEKTVLEITNLTATTAMARTADRLTGLRGEIVAEWEHVYLLSQTAEGIRAAVAMPDNEIYAWQARGTPLGAFPVPPAPASTASRFS